MDKKYIYLEDITIPTDENALGIKYVDNDWEDLIEHKELIRWDVVLEYLDEHLCEFDVEEIGSYSKWIETFKKEMEKYIIKK